MNIILERSFDVKILKYTFYYDSTVKQKPFRWLSSTLQGQKRQLKIGLHGLRSSERTRFLKKLFERFEHIQNDRPYVFRRIAGCAYLNS